MNKETIQKKIEYFWQKVFGKKMGDTSKKFLKNMSLSFVGGIIAFATLFLVNILAARFLGPEEYGRYMFFASIATAFSIFLVLEADAGISYSLSRAKREGQSKIISSIVFLFLIISLLFTSFVFLFKEQFLSFLNYFIETDNNTIFFIIGLAVIFSLKRLQEGILRGKKLFLPQLIIKILEAFSVLVIFFAIYKLFGVNKYFDYFQAVFWGSFIAIFGTIIILRKDISFFKISLSSVKSIYKYSRLGFINSIATLILKNADKFLVIAFFDIKTVGIYAAYYTVSILPAARINQLFINVYFPSISSGVNKKALYEKIKKTLKISFIPIFFIAIFFIYTLILLFGSKYPINYLWIILLSVYVAIHFFASISAWTLSGFSEDGFSWHNKGIFWGLIVFLILIGVAIIVNKFSISFLIFSFIINRLVVGVYSFKKLKSFI
jgi:O-antigen/teichoic acid export membrane protein